MENIFKIMVGLQHKFNEETIENYLDKNLNWNSAIIAKSGELLDSLGYKWWKKVVPDMENVKVEAIDLLHFVICDYLQKNYNDNKFYIIRTIDEFRISFLDKGFNLSFSLEQQVNQLNLNSIGRFITMKQIFNHLNMSNDDVYIAYIVKNCLNKFRQNNGYKDGSYIKDWNIKDWNGKEDNVVAYGLANIIGVKENLFDELHESLNLYYNKEVLKNKYKSIEYGTDGSITMNGPQIDSKYDNLDYSKAFRN